MAESDYINALNRWFLSGSIPDRLVVHGADIIPGDPTRGMALLDGEFAFSGQIVEMGEAMPWRVRPPRDPWHTALHGFAWLRDLKTLASSRARQRARTIVVSWVENFGRWDAPSWRPHITGRRIAAWIANGDFLLKDAGADFEKIYFSSLARQSRFLARAALKGDDGAARFSAIKGLIYSGVCLPHGEGRARRGLKLIEVELARQIAADGGHCERSPSMHMAALRELVEIRQTLLDARREPPVALQVAIDRMAPMLRTFRHGDGGLALFNDGIEKTDWMVDLVLAQADARGRPHASAPHSGFQILRAGRSYVIVDAGTPPAIGRRAHAGTLSFEMSVGKDRLIVNCGSYHGPDAPWRRAVRATAAHSALCVDDYNSSDVLEDGRLGRRRAEVSVTRRDHEGAVWIDSSHNGYVSSLGLEHRRRLYLSGDGCDLRGEDVLIRRNPQRSKGKTFAVRFHLHPSVDASLAEDGSVVWLRLPNSAGWQMRALGGRIGLAESVYLGAPGARRRTDQIVIEGPVEQPETVIKWAFRRID